MRADSGDSAGHGKVACAIVLSGREIFESLPHHQILAEQMSRATLATAANRVSQREQSS
jgi:hypothetical protein